MPLDNESRFVAFRSLHSKLWNKQNEGLKRIVIETTTRVPIFFNDGSVLPELVTQTNLSQSAVPMDADGDF